MSKILIISATFPPEPVVSANLSYDIANKLSEKDNVIVVCPYPSRPKGFNHKLNFDKKNVGFKIEYLDSYKYPDANLFGRIRESYSFGIKCKKYLRKNKRSIKSVYINSWPFISQYLIINEALKSNIKTVLHIQDIYPESLVKKLPNFIGFLLNKILLPIDKYILNNATKIIGISKNMNSYLSITRKISLNKFDLVRNWQNDGLFKKINVTTNNSSEFVFMFTGSISPSAGVDIIIKSFIKAKIDNSKLIIAGDGSEKDKCINIAKEIGNSKIKFYKLTPKNTPKIQSKASVLILPLKKGIASTATPSKLTAYLFSGKPILACVELNTDISDIIINRKCGIISLPEDVDSISKGMKDLHSMKKNKLKNMGNNSKKYAESFLSRKKNLKKCISIIKNV